MNEELLRGVLLGFATLVGGLSLWGVVSPSALIGTVKGLWSRPWAMHLAVAVRLLLGAVILVVADRSRFPVTFLVLGWLTIAAGVGLMFMGRGRADRIIDGVKVWPEPVLRLWCMFGVAFGAFLAWGVA